MTSSDNPEADAESPPRSAAADARRGRWPVLVIGSLLIAVVGWACVSAFAGYVGSHPVGWITLLVTLAGGLTLVSWSVMARPPDATSTRRGRHRVAAVAIGLVAALLIGVVIYTRPFPARSVAVDALVDGAGVDVDDGWTRITMQPDAPRTTGLAFYPGAKVDPRAYAQVLRPIAEAGYPVIIFKQPYNLAILDSDAANAVVGASDDVDRWVVGGHSLGGAMASRYAEISRDELVGLVLHAAFPVNDMSDRELFVASISGTDDGLADTADIADSVPKLPSDTEFVAIEGAIHSHFGDYGPQRGDGDPTITRESAQAQIVSATLDLLASVDRSPQASGTP